jgi:hypothetical protein
MRRDWYAVTALRIDPVRERENRTWWLELAEGPGAKVLGNVQVHAHLLPFYQG